MRGRSKHVVRRHAGSGNQDHGHWEMTQHGNRGRTLIRITHGIYRVMTICCTVNKSAVFIVQSPAFGSCNPDSQWFFLSRKQLIKAVSTALGYTSCLPHNGYKTFTMISLQLVQKKVSFSRFHAPLPHTYTLQLYLHLSLGSFTTTFSCWDNYVYFQSSLILRKFEGFLFLKGFFTEHTMNSDVD